MINDPTNISQQTLVKYSNPVTLVYAPVGPMSPVTENTNGEKHALSTSWIRSSYTPTFLLFMSSQCIYDNVIRNKSSHIEKNQP